MPLHVFLYPNDLGYIWISSVHLEKDNEGWNALHWAAKMGAFTILPILVKVNSGLDDVHVPSGKTPLHICASKGLLECTKILLAAGAQPLLADRNGQTVSNNTLCKNL